MSYGAIGGARAAEHLRLIAGVLRMADVRTTVALSMVNGFENSTHFAPGKYQSQALDALFGEVVAWSDRLTSLRLANT